jgi:hypothetical protein
VTVPSFYPNFDNGVSLTVMSSLAYMGSDGNIQQSENFREAAPAVLALLDRTVLSAEGTEAGTLTLHFDGGGMLIIYDDSEHYESYTIEHEGQTIVV